MTEGTASGTVAGMTVVCFVWFFVRNSGCGDGGGDGFDSWRLLWLELVERLLLLLGSGVTMRRVDRD